MSICLYCGGSFERKSAKKKHCSDSCRDKDRYQKDGLHRELKQQRARQWFYQNRDRVRITQKAYYQSHYPEFAAKNMQRAGRMLDAKLIQQVLEEGNYTCRYCYQHGGKLTIDHKIPVSRGGSDERSNLCVACHGCNCSKNNKTPEEFAAYRQELANACSH